MGTEDDHNKKNHLLTKHGVAISKVKTVVERLISPQEHFVSVAINNLDNLTKDNLKKSI